MLKFKEILIIIFLMTFSLDSVSLEAEKIIVNGNKRISRDTILNYIDLKEKLNISNLVFLNKIQKDLFETGFFSNVEIKYLNNGIVVNIIENPFIKFFYVDGISSSEFNDLQKIFLNKENSFFFRK